MHRAFGLALVAVLAAACQQTSSPPVAKRSVVPDSADQVMYGVRFFLTDGGLRRAELVSDTAFMYDENTRTELRVVNTTFYKVSGEKDAVLTSRTGSYNIRLGSMEARGNVVVVSTEGSKTRIDDLLSKGVRAYIRKPFTPEKVKAVVDELLGGGSNES